MSHPITELDRFDDAVVVPDVNDTTYPTTIPQGMGALANRTRFQQNTLTLQFVADTLEGLVPGNGSFQVPIPPLGRADSLRAMAQHLMTNIKYLASAVWGAAGVGTSLFPVALAPTVESDGGATSGPPGLTYFQPSAAANQLAWTQVSIAPSTSPAIWIPITGLPLAGRISGFSYGCQGGTGHSGTLPGVMPKLTLLKNLGGTITPIASKTDTSSSAALYETLHGMSVLGLTEPLAQDTYYFFKWEGESGSNKQPGLSLSSIIMTIDPT